MIVSVLVKESTVDGVSYCLTSQQVVKVELPRKCICCATVGCLDGNLRTDVHVLLCSCPCINASCVVLLTSAPSRKGVSGAQLF